MPSNGGPFSPVTAQVWTGAPAYVHYSSLTKPPVIIGNSFLKHQKKVIGIAYGRAVRDFSALHGEITPPCRMIAGRYIGLIIRLCQKASPELKPCRVHLWRGPEALEILCRFLHFCRTCGYP
jgi:hypothetical protein